MTCERFSGHIGDRFRVELGEAGHVHLELIEAEPHPAGTHSAPGFALVFRGPPETLLHQGLRGLDHERLGSFQLFLSPIGQAAEGFTYEAVFTHEPED